MIVKIPLMSVRPVISQTVVNVVKFCNVCFLYLAAKL